MPQAASKKQYRMMMAILHGKGGDDGGSRGRPPKSIASKYTSPGEGAPESKDNDRGGNWDAGAHKKAKKKVEAKRIARKLRRSKLRKSFEQYYKGKGAGVIVVNKKGQILIGECSKSGKWCTPGGHVNPDENFEQGAARELHEEAGLKALSLKEIGMFAHSGNDNKVFLVTNFAGKPKSIDGELKNLKWIDAHAIGENVRDCCAIGIKMYLQSSLKKSDLKAMVAIETLEKNILRGTNGTDAVFDVSHGDALRLVGNGVFRMIQRAVAGMGDEDFKTVLIDNYQLSIRKHMNDVYSGRINDGHKMIHQFAHRSLPQMCADLMSVFEWYHPEDEGELQILSEEHLPDDAIHGGLNELVDNYRKHNLSEIYKEMETMREEIRQGNTVDLIQIEDNIMKLFDKLENFTHTIAEQHNKLAEEAGEEIERVEAKLLELQAKIDSLHNSEKTIEAYTSDPQNGSKVYADGFFYLPKPSIIVEPSGKIKITFDKEWSTYDQENFLHDMRAKVIKKK